MGKIKTGIKTSEFWIALLGALIPVFNEHFGLRIPTESVLSIAGVIISYIIGRSYVKAKQ